MGHFEENQQKLPKYEDNTVTYAIFEQRILYTMHVWRIDRYKEFSRFVAVFCVF